MIGFEDTICAVSTAPGVGGIAVIRVSGRDACGIVDRVWRGKRLSEVKSHTAHLGNIVDERGEVLDEAVATVFRAPASFTGEDVIELSVHGSVWIQRELVQLLVRQGCRTAGPGEFTRRAFASGKLDLAEAEAIADVISSSSRAAHRLAMSQMKGGFSRCLDGLRERMLELSSLLELELDFSEEDVEFASRENLRMLADDIYGVVERMAASFATGAAIKEGVPVALVGATNAGKSTLLNRMIGDDRAIVSDIHGTTRDIIEEHIEIEGIKFRLIDTAGLRETTDKIESLGIERTEAQIDKASIVVWVIDPATTGSILRETAVRIGSHITPNTHLIIAINKSDLAPNREVDVDTNTNSPIYEWLREQSLAPDPILPIAASPVIRISAATGEGIDRLNKAMVTATGINGWANELLVTNTRHYEALTNALSALSRVRQGLADNLSGDFIAQDVRETIHHLGEITGAITTDHILSTIFSRFCVGK